MQDNEFTLFEAAQKICPEIIGKLNSTDKDGNPVPVARCIGTDCMAWHWTDHAEASCLVYIAKDKDGWWFIEPEHNMKSRWGWPPNDPENWTFELNQTVVAHTTRIMFIAKRPLYTLTERRGYCGLYMPRMAEVEVNP